MSWMDRVNPYWLYIKLGAALALLAAVWWWGYSTKAVACEAAQANERARAEQVIAEFARAERDAVQAARESEQAHAAELATIAEQHEQDKRDAEAAHDRLVADLRAGTVRLHNRWAGCQATAGVSGASRSAAELDAAAADREASASRAIGAAREADDWIKRLQDVIRSDRQTISE